MYQSQKMLIDQWCKATVDDAVRMFHFARIQPENEPEQLEVIAVRCANSAFQHVAQTIIGDRDATAKRYGQLCYERFRREIPRVITADAVKEVIH